MKLSSSVQLLVTISIALHVALVAVLAATRVWKRYPAFSVYALCNFIEFVATYATYDRPQLYFVIYVVGETLTIALGVFVVYELFRELFSRHQALRNLATFVMQISAVFLIVLAAAVLYTHSPIGRHQVEITLMIVEEAARIIELGCVVFLFVFSGVFGLHWRQWMFGIALGLGILVASKLLVVTMLPYANRAMIQVWYTVSAASYDIALLVWVGYLFSPERAVASSELPQHSQLEQWNQAILELIHQ